MRACSSTGAPETTAAAVVSLGSLPSMTLIGTGVKFLSHHRLLQQSALSFKSHSVALTMCDSPRPCPSGGDAWVWLPQRPLDEPCQTRRPLERVGCWSC